MPWSSIGTVNPNENWQSYPESIIGGEVLRITQGLTDPYNLAYISRYFALPQPGGRLRPWTRIYPSTEPIIINLPLPEGFKESGNTVYVLQIKRKLPYYPTPWNIQIEVFY